MVNYLKFFDLNEDFTKEELKSAYIKKVKEIDALNISDFDKQFYIEQSYQLYRKAKNDLYYSNNLIDINYNDFFNRPFSLFNNFFNNMNLLTKGFDKIDKEKSYAYSEYKSYTEKLNEDKSKTITETIKTNKNGVESITTNSYKKYLDGKIEPITKQLTE